MKSNMLKRMRELAATSESKTRQLAVTKSKNISGLSALKKLMPKSVDKIVDEVEVGANMSHPERELTC